MSNRTCMYVAAIALFLLVQVLGAALPAEASTLSLADDPGAISDPLGDSSTWGEDYSTADLTGASVDILGDKVRFRVTLATPFLDNSVVYIDLDSDQNPATGVTWWEAPGADYMCRFKNENGLWSFDAFGLTSPYNQLSPVNTTVFDNGLEASVPLSVFVNSSDGHMNFRALTALYLGVIGGYDSYTGVLDIAPGDYDNVVWAQSCTIPEPSTFVLLATAAFGLLAYAWRRRRQAA
jgi:hypothetical protein